MLSSTTIEEIPIADVKAKSEFVPFTALYAGTIFLSAFLLFQVQLIIGKYVLPWFGGSPSVWNTCLLLFQILLLLGYFYAHVVSTRLPMRSQTRVHFLFLLASLAMLAVTAQSWPSPITPGAIWKPIAAGSSPEWRLIIVLAVSVGFPFLILSTTGPLLQVWVSRTQRGSPYRLYALSNAGSLLGLLSYPFLAERFLVLRTQAWVWSVVYALFLFAYGACAWVLRGQGATVESAPVEVSRDSEKPNKTARLIWLGLAACASAMLLATTNQICQEIAVIPLLWVLPLCVYLATFILCFGKESWYRRSIFYPLYAVGSLGALMVLSTKFPHILIEISVFCLALFAVCMVCHGELVKRKPAREFLSTFYLTIATGGALGSILVVLIAPRIFQRYWEFQLSLLLCGLLVLIVVLLDKESWFYKRPSLRILLYAVIVAFMLQGLYYGRALVAMNGGGQVAFRARNFFGVKTGIQDQAGNWLTHGRIRHGVQLRDPAVHDEPTLYYKRLSGVGLILDHYPAPLDRNGKRRGLRVGVVGLGAGTLAAYGHSGDYFRFYEIDPQVVELSLGPKPWFTFLQDSRATVDIVMGDARISLESEAERGQFQRFDVMVLDAFSSDSIPVHLLTKEAMALYIQHLSGPDAVIAFHLSNRALDLRPVAYGLSSEYRMTSVEVHQPGFSVWVLASANPEMMNLPELKERSKPVTVNGAVPVWTDEYSNLFNVIRPLR